MNLQTDCLIIIYTTMKITGNFNPKTGTEEEYTVDFEQELTHDTIINCNIWDEVKGEQDSFLLP